MGIIGAGLMGRSVALCALQRGLDVTLVDHDANARETASRWVDEHLNVAAGSLRFAESPATLGDCDILLEAVVENRSVKRRLLSSLSQLSSTAVIATNTSSLSIADLATAVDHPDRFCGLHFCHPVAECPLVEMVAGPTTRRAILERGESFVRQLGLVPLRTRDVPGFAVNRLLFPYLEAAVALIRGGVQWSRIERCAADFGMRIGPLSQMDEIGIDVILRAAAAFHRGNPVVPPQSELLLAMYQAGRRGRKSGRGFFDYRGAGPVRPDAESVALVATHGAAAVSCSDEDLQMRLFVPMYAAACGLLDEDVVADAMDVRKALSGGLGCRGDAADLPGWGAKLGGAALAEWRDRLQLAQFDPAVLSD